MPETKHLLDEGQYTIANPLGIGASLGQSLGVALEVCPTDLAAAEVLVAAPTVADRDPALSFSEQFLGGIGSSAVVDEEAGHVPRGRAPKPTRDPSVRPARLVRVHDRGSLCVLGRLLIRHIEKRGRLHFDLRDQGDREVDRKDIGEELQCVALGQVEPADHEQHQRAKARADLRLVRQTRSRRLRDGVALGTLAGVDANLVDQRLQRRDVEHLDPLGFRKEVLLPQASTALATAAWNVVFGRGHHLRWHQRRPLRTVLSARILLASSSVLRRLLSPLLLRLCVVSRRGQGTVERVLAKLRQQLRELLFEFGNAGVLFGNAGVLFGIEPCAW